MNDHKKKGFRIPAMINPAFITKKQIYQGVLHMLEHLIVFDMKFNDQIIKTYGEKYNRIIVYNSDPSYIYQLHHVSYPIF